MTYIKDAYLVVDYCRKNGFTAMDVRGWGGLRRIEAAMQAGVNGTLTRDDWSNVAVVLEAERAS